MRDPLMYANLVRFVVVALGALVSGATFVVIGLHARAWRATRPTPEPRGPSQSWVAWKWQTFMAPGRVPGLLPLHVLAVAMSHECFVVGTALGALDQQGTPSITWRFYLYIVGSVLTLIALWIIGVSQRRRMSHSRVRTITRQVEVHTIDDSGT